MNRKKRPKRKKIFYFWHLLAMLLGSAAFFFHFAFDIDPMKIEYGYSRPIYPYFRSLLVGLGNLLPQPHSAFEAILAITAIIVAAVFFRSLHAAVKGKQTVGRLFMGTFLNCLGILAGGYFLFWAAWGLNYLREPGTGVINGESTATLVSGDYLKLADDMVVVANNARINGIDTTAGMAEIDAAVDKALGKTLAANFDCRIDSWPETKFMIAGEFMNMFAISGIFIPFSMEPHINSDLLEWERPFTAAHEKAHYAGYASETDANLIAWMACLSSDTGLLRYSAALNVLLFLRPYIHEKEWTAIVNGRLVFEARNDLRNRRKRMAKNRELYAKWFKIGEKVNDTYLKMNTKKIGIESYRAALPHLALWWKNRDKKIKSTNPPKMFQYGFRSRKIKSKI